MGVQWVSRSVYVLERYLSEWEVVGLYTSLDGASQAISKDLARWTAPIQYRLDLKIVWGYTKGD